MKGDFSNWNKIDRSNLNGILHQQGRVFLDRDWNDQTQLTLDWQDRAAQHIIGAKVAAISTQEIDAFKVDRAKVEEGEVKLEIYPGQAWVNGLAVTLPGDLMVTRTRTATYLDPPIQDPSGTVSDLKNGIRDAVILEVWREELNGFQMPNLLIEPALGGPDTTERVLTSMRFRLFRLADDEDCHNIIDKLKDARKGNLTVSLQETTETDGDCPVVEGGGYTGFEHQLYRIEIAQVNGDVSMFKWSQFNGGLVGRGEFKVEGTNKKIQLTANDQAIKMSGLTNFYLEVVKLDDEQGFWRVIYGAEVTLNGDDLAVSAERYVEAILPSGNVFFRLWNGISPIASFPKATEPAEPNELRDGIRLEFDNPNTTTYYRSGDYWTFKVRAGEIINETSLIDDKPPQGIEYHRVPLAELNWDTDLEISFEAEQIEDCREIFRPLTKQKGCCTFSVGDGKTSHGDFNSIEQALRHLPKSGGKICLLPGLHEANATIQGKRNIKIEGCGKHTRIIPRKETRESPIFYIIDSECIALLDMDLVTLGGTTIVLEGTEVGTLKEIEIASNRIIACKEAINVKQGIKIHIHHNQIRMWDKKDAGVAIYLMAEDSFIDRNDIGVIPAENTPPLDNPNGGETPDPTDSCADLEIVYTSIPAFIAYINLIWQIPLFFIPTNPYKALGGIQIAGGSERVKLWENKIQGGAGNGIALGTSVAKFLEELEENPEEEEQSIEHKGGDLWGYVTSGETGIQGITVIFEMNGTTFSTRTDDGGYFLIREVPAGEYSVTIATPGYKIEDITAQDEGEFGISQNISVVEEEIDWGNLLAFIYDLEIDRNEISHMGLSGIGIPRITTEETVPRQIRPFVSFLKLFGNPIIDLNICNNQIEKCWQNEFERQLESEANFRGFGGISLGIVANLLIRDNRIENNGTSHISPTCGILISYGEIVEIAQNWIINNGAISSNTGTDLRSGNRGGIIAIASSIPTLSALSEENPAVLLGKPAARLYDNRIDQPVGQALGLAAMGAISVNNNYFKSELSGVRFLDQLVGGVFILNFGGLDRAGKQTTNTVKSKAFMAAPATHFTRNSKSEACLPNGNTLFNSNQTYLGFANTSFISQFIVSADDIGFDSNQSDALGRGLQLPNQITFIINTWLWGATLRANNNRFKEGQVSQTSVKVSLLTLSTLMNNTTNNQGDHCIFAFNTASVRPAIAPGNQVLDTTYCDRLFQTSQQQG